VPADKPLRFCMVTTFYPPYHFGGDAVFVYRLVEALAALGHQVEVVHSVDAYRLKHPAEPEIAFTHHPNVTIHGLQSARPLAAALLSHQTGRPAGYGGRLRAILEDGGFDVIHFHNISLMGGPGVLRLGRGVKLYTSHEYWLVCPTHVLFAFNREACTKRRCIRCTLHSRRPPQLWRHTGLVNRCLRGIDQVFAPSRFALEQLRAGGVRAPLSVLPHFVPSPPPGAEDESHPNDGRPYFLFVGRLEKLKGVQDILPLFAGPGDFDFILVGGGDFAATLRAQAHGMDRVKFLGAIHPARIGGLYRNATALITPSLCYETFGLIAAESLAHGTPVIARRIGALAELVTESGGGLLFTDLVECHAALRRLRGEPGLRAELGGRGRAWVQARLGVDTHLRSYLQLVRSHVGGRAASPALGAAR
jgi:glycosyltransferase involved in cell wall biosynthesis